MSGFHNILVGVDLTKSKPLGVAGLDSVAESAVGRALWVARGSSAPLTFLSALPHRGKAEPAWHLSAEGIADQLPSSGPVEDAARHALAGLVRRAKEQGVEARAVLVHGEAWVEICRQVVRDEHDLLVVGTHDTHGLRSLWLGGTARKLLHECPCPVWVSKPGREDAPRNVLVASDLSLLSEAAVRHGLSIAGLAGAHTHILDVVEYPLDRLGWRGGPDAPTMRYHARIRAEAERGLHAQLERSGVQTASPAVTVHTADGIPDHAILEFIRLHRIDLVVLGTVARHGLSGILLGNTAERLLPEVPCSILVVKPAEFHCPVEADTENPERPAAASPLHQG